MSSIKEKGYCPHCQLDLNEDLEKCNSCGLQTSYSYGFIELSAVSLWSCFVLMIIPCVIIKIIEQFMTDSGSFSPMLFGEVYKVPNLLIFLVISFSLFFSYFRFRGMRQKRVFKNTL